MKLIKTLIMGAAGRDFHNFNVVYRQNNLYEVVAFTATQIPDIEGRNYPSELSGELYPNGIPIHDESKLVDLIAEHDVEEVVFSYSDITHEYVMHKASQVLAVGAHFKLLGGEQTMIQSSKPVISVCAVRTGCGKSQTTRKVAEILKAAGKQVAVIRHPMPYGDLAKQGVQRFTTLEDLEKHDCTIEEMEEYEPHITRGTVVFAGADYEAIIREAEKEWIKYILVIGEREAGSENLSVRERNVSDVKEVSFDEFVTEIQSQTDDKPYSSLNVPLLLSKRPVIQV